MPAMFSRFWIKEAGQGVFPWTTALVPGLAATAIGLGLWGLGGWDALERLIHTGLFRLHAAIASPQWDDRLVVIAIDEASLATYGPYPWSRDRYADLLDHLMTVQPAAIGLDILMPEPRAEDAQLVESIRFSGNVVLPVGDDGQGNAVQVTPTLTEPAAGFFRLGHVKHILDSDGISRQFFLYERHGEAIAPSFAIALVQTYQESLANVLTADSMAPPELEAGTAAYLAAPERYDQTQPLGVNWPGLTRPQSPEQPRSPHGLTTLSFAAVMADDGSAGLLNQLQNKIVLVGYTAVGIVGQGEDPLRTPFEQRIPTAGVYLHAAVVDNLLGDRFLNPFPLPWTLGLTVLSGVGISLVLKPLGGRGRLLVVLGLVPVWLAIAYGSFRAGFWLPAVPIGTSLLGVAAFQFVEQLERKALMDLFIISLSPEMANFVWHHKDELLTQGQILPQTLQATILFVDIRSFTTLAETLPSEVLLPWLNRYFEVMTDCIMDHGGVVDKYIGDAIMAAFGAPVPRTSPEAIRQDALAAVTASIAMVDRLVALNQEFASQGLPTLRFGVGIHTGTVVAGTVGSRHRANYSLFGDTVNVADRLQNMTKELLPNADYPILISEATYQQVCDRYGGVEKGEIQLRGRTTGTRIYAIALNASALN
jgi:adenylate cyclase